MLAHFLKIGEYNKAEGKMMSKCTVNTFRMCIHSYSTKNMSGLTCNRIITEGLEGGKGIRKTVQAGVRLASNDCSIS